MVISGFWPHSSPQRNIQGHWASPQHKPPTSPSRHLLWSCPSARAILMKQWSAPKWGVLSVLKDGYKMTGLMCRVTKTQGSSHVWVVSGLCGCICRPSVCGCVCSMCWHVGIQNRTKLVRSRLRGLDRRQEIVWNFVLDFLALNVNLYWNIIRIPEIIVSSNSSEIPLLMISCLNKTSQSNLTLTDLDLWLWAA